MDSLARNQKRIAASFIMASQLAARPPPWRRGGALPASAILHPMTDEIDVYRAACQVRYPTPRTP